MSNNNNNNNNNKYDNKYDNKEENGENKINPMKATNAPQMPTIWKFSQDMTKPKDKADEN